MAAIKKSTAKKLARTGIAIKKQRRVKRAEPKTISKAGERREIFFFGHNGDCDDADIPI